MKYKYPLFKIHVNIEDTLDRLRKVFESGFLNEGKEVTELREALKQ
mgnify:FL=1